MKINYFMKILIEKIKLLAIVLTVSNLILTIVGFYNELLLTVVLSLFFTVELIILLLYLLVVTYGWINVELKENSEKYISNQEGFKNLMLGLFLGP